MTHLNVALLQMTASGYDQEANRTKGERFCRRAAEMGTDVALFPEMWNVGYTFPEASGPEAHKAWLAQAGEEEGVYMAAFDMEAIRTYRRREVWGNAYRKPGRYEDLVAPDVPPPFVREDARR